MAWDGKSERRSIIWEDVVSHIATTNQVLKDVDGSIRALDDKVGIQNGRILKLENWRSWILGGLTVVTFIAGIILGKTGGE